MSSAAIELPKAVGPTRPALALRMRRLLAFAVDATIMGIAGSILAWPFFDTFAHLGGWGRSVGFLLALPYFSVLNSARGRGQTLGKRVAGLRVIGRDGQPISWPRSVARYAILAAPFFLNFVRVTTASVWLMAIIVAIVFGLGGAFLYLFLFNRTTGQLPHDLAVGTYVVRASEGAIAIDVPVPATHVVIAGVVAALSFAAPLIGLRVIAGNPTFQDLFGAAQRIARTSGADGVWLGRARNYAWVSGQPARRSENLTAQVVVRDGVALDAQADSVAVRLFREYPAARTVDLVIISVSYGFDIGIASGWRSFTASYSPGAWKARLPGANPS